MAFLAARVEEKNNQQDEIIKRPENTVTDGSNGYLRLGFCQRY